MFTWPSIIKCLAIVLVIAVGYYVWYVHFNYRFEEISKDKVYKSALIPPEHLGEYLGEKNIKTVINLLNPDVQDGLNPATQNEIDAEEQAISAFNKQYNADVNHINIPSKQVPDPDKVAKFLEILDNPASYPVLIHCYHGTGRAELYSALYRMEFEKWSNKDARDKTRLITEGLGYKSSFALGRGKGDFLNNYQTREERALKPRANLTAVSE